MKQQTQWELIEYRERGRIPNSFLLMVLTNNLTGAFMEADEVNARDMKEIVSWVYNMIPTGGWKTIENVQDWISQGGMEGLDAQRTP